MEKKVEERLRVIGRLIGIYRVERRNNSQNRFTQKAFSEGICTVNTLKKIEAGELPRFYDIYLELLEKLDLKYGYFSAVDNGLLALMDKLYKAIEYYRLDEILDCCAKGLRILVKVKDYVYYSELYELFLATEKFYADDMEISKKKFRHFFSIYTFVDEKFHLLFKMLLYARVSIDETDDLFEYKKMIRELGFLESSVMIERVWALNYHYVQKDFITLNEEVSKLEELLVLDKNYVRLLDVYNYAVYMFGSIEYARRKEYIQKAESLIIHHKLPDIKVAEFYTNLAGALHNCKQYADAINYYEKMLAVSGENIYLPSLICMAHSQRMAGQSVTIPSLKEEYVSKYPNLYQLMYNYYLRPEISLYARMNFIQKEIAPYLMEDEVIRIFRDEMKILVKETNCYKNLYIFEETVENNVK